MDAKKLSKPRIEPTRKRKISRWDLLGSSTIVLAGAGLFGLGYLYKSLDYNPQTSKVERKVENSEESQTVKPVTKEKLEEKVQSSKIKSQIVGKEGYKLPNGDYVRQGSVLHYDDLGCFVEACEGKTVRTNSLEIGGADTKPKRTYLFFDGETHEDFSEPYLSLGNSENDYKISVGSPKGRKSASVEFLEGNKYGGVKIEGDDKLIVQAVGGDISVENRLKQREPPKITSNGFFYVVSGNQLIKYEREKDGKERLRLHDVVKINGKQLQGYSPTPLELEVYDKGEKVLKTKHIYVDDNKINIVSRIDSLPATIKPSVERLEEIPTGMPEKIRGTPEGPANGGYIGVDPSVVEYLKKHKVEEILREHPEYFENWRKNTGKDRNSLVDDMTKGMEVENRGYDNSGNILVHPDVIRDWQEYQRRESGNPGIIADPKGTVRK